MKSSRKWKIMTAKIKDSIGWQHWGNLWKGITRRQREKIPGKNLKDLKDQSG